MLVAGKKSLRYLAVFSGIAHKLKPQFGMGRFHADVWKRSWNFLWSRKYESVSIKKGLFQWFLVSLVGLGKLCCRMLQAFRIFFNYRQFLLLGPVASVANDAQGSAK